MVDTVIAIVPESKLSPEIDGDITAENHDEQSRDIKKLCNIVNVLYNENEFLKGAVQELVDKSSSIEYDITMSIIGHINFPNLLLGFVIVPRSMIIRKDFMNSFALSRVSPSEDMEFVVKVNDSFASRILFTAGTLAGVFSQSDSFTLNKGDMISIHTIDEVNSRIRDVSITITGCANLTSCVT